MKTIITTALATAFINELDTEELFQLGNKLVSFNGNKDLIELVRFELSVVREATRVNTVECNVLDAFIVSIMGDVA